MRILGIESSALVASVALVTDDILTAEYTVDFKKTHSQTLLPMIDEVARMLELDLNTIDAIAVAGGPGSFTGLRIGAATAKGLGLALEKPLIHVPTVDALAYNLWGAKELVCPIMDARRRQVYTGLYRMNPEMETQMEQTAMDAGKLAQLLNDRGCLLYTSLLFKSMGKMPTAIYVPSMAYIAWCGFLPLMQRENGRPPLSPVRLCLILRRIWM